MNMSDINFWSKFYWENDLIGIKNLRNLLDNENPENLAKNIVEKVTKIDVDYFQEASEYSLSYRPSIQNDKKFSKLKKEIGDKKKNINLVDFISILNEKENGYIFYYYLLLYKKTSSTLDETIRKKIKKYDEKIINYLKSKLIKDTENNKNNKNFYFIGKELNRLVDEKYKSQMLVLNFYMQSKYEDWFKKNLNIIINQHSFLFFNSNYLLQCNSTEMLKWYKYLKENVLEDEIKKFNGKLSAELIVIKNNAKENQLVILENFINLNPIDYQGSFRKVLFSGNEDREGIEYWYSIITMRLKDKKIFFDNVWESKESRDGKVNYEANLDCELINFMLKEMAKNYNSKEIENLDFSKTFISNENVNEILKTKLRYYLLDNKLESKKVIKGTKI